MPPPNVPALAEKVEGGRPAASVRERLEQHRKNPVCASCHAAMDPLGFALENFDAIGMWRSTDANTPIDPSGVLPDGTKFEGPAGLRGILVQRGDQFVSTVTERLLTYALGRGLGYYDMPAVRRIVQDAAARNFHFSSLVLGVVNSAPFQMKIKKAPAIQNAALAAARSN